MIPLIDKKIILSGVYNIVVLALFFWVSGIFGVLGYLVWMCFYGVILFLLYWLVKKFKKDQYVLNAINFKTFMLHFFHRGALLILILVGVLGIFCYYQNEISPAPMPRYTVTNGEKTLVFQGMSHIATPRFYQEVADMVSDNKKHGYVLFFEGVRAGTQQNEENFDKALGVKFNKDTYSYLSKIYGLINQDNKKFLGLVNGYDFNVDVTINDIMTQYDAIKTPQSVNPLAGDTPVDMSQEIVAGLAELGPNQLKVLQYLNRGLINAIIKSDGVQSTIYDNFTNKDLFSVILHNRNQVLASEIENSKYNHIVTLYGLLHFQGIFQILKDDDIRWRIEKIEYLYPIK